MLAVPADRRLGVRRAAPLRSPTDHARADPRTRPPRRHLARSCGCCPSPLALAATAAGWLLLPHLLRGTERAGHRLTVARLLMLTLTIMFVADLMNGVVLGDQDFGFSDGSRVLQPLALALAFGMLWWPASSTVSTAVAATAPSPPRRPSR